MSTFAVTVERIGRIWPHDNADRLEMASLEGKAYEFVVGKGDFQPGDSVIYFPVDSVLPAWICEKLNLTGKLTGKEQNRVKTVRLRGNISQGIVCSTAQLAPAISDNAGLGDDVTEALGVTKYEAPIIPSVWGNLAPLPRLVSAYDIESAQNFVGIVDQYLMDSPCYITEKLEGSNWSATLYRDGELIASQRNYRIIPVPGGEHDWYKVIRTQNLDEALKTLMAEMIADEGNTLIQAITLRGEMLGPGIQSNIYGLKNHEVRLFDIEVNGTPVDAARFLDYAARYNLSTAPVLAVGMTLRSWLDGRDLREASNGKSALADRLREGIVIKPMVEGYEPKIGRVFVKQRSPEYLAKSEF